MLFKISFPPIYITILPLKPNPLNSYSELKSLIIIIIIPSHVFCPEIYSIE